MNDFKLVPVKPTPEMERAAESYWNERRFMGLSDDPRTWAGVYQAMLAAAPAVRGELVGWQFYKHGKWWNGDILTKNQRKNIEKEGVRVRNVYAEPQLAEQQPAPDVRCEGCGYMTRHREHMGCVRAAKQNQADVSGQASPTPFESAINRVREASDRIQNTVDEWERHIAASGMPSPLTRIVPEGFLAHLRSVILGIDSAYRGSPSPENQYLLGQCVDALTGLIPDIDAALADHRKGDQP